MDLREAVEYSQTAGGQVAGGVDRRPLSEGWQEQRCLLPVGPQASTFEAILRYIGGVFERCCFTSPAMAL